MILDVLVQVILVQAKLVLGAVIVRRCDVLSVNHFLQIADSNCEWNAAVL